jgi:hypothetical protein
MVHSAAYHGQHFIDPQLADTYIEGYHPTYCPFCGSDTDCNVRFCQTCRRALPSDPAIQSGRLEHTFSTAGLSVKRRVADREPGLLRFDSSKRQCRVEKAGHHVVQLGLGLALIVITIISVACFVQGKMPL